MKRGFDWAYALVHDYDVYSGKHVIVDRAARAPKIITSLPIPMAIVVRSSWVVTRWHFVVRSCLTIGRAIRRTASSVRRSRGS